MVSSVSYQKILMKKHKRFFTCDLPSACWLVWQYQKVNVVTDHLDFVG